MEDIISRPSGFLSVCSIRLKDGTPVHPRQAIAQGLIKVNEAVDDSWHLSQDEVGLGSNLFTDSGRQLMAYLFGGKSTMTNWKCAQFGIGTGTTPPNVTNTSLEAPINFGVSQGGNPLKAVSGVDYPNPFIVRVLIELDANDAVGFLLSEFGLFSYDGTLLARKTVVGTNKAAVSLGYSWRIRF